MKQEMGEGYTAVLEGLGRFKISIVSDTGQPAWVQYSDIKGGQVW